MKLFHKLITLSLFLAIFATISTPAAPVFAGGPAQIQGELEEDNKNIVNPCTDAPGQEASDNNFRTNLCDIAEGPNSFSRIIGNAITIVFILAAVIALFYLVWGGVKWILSGGDKGKVEAARSTIIAAIIGLVVTFLAYFILNFVLSLFGLTLGDLQLPELTSGPQG